MQSHGSFQPPGFACNNCGKCCTNLSANRAVLVGPQEILAMARHLDLLPSEFVAQHLQLIQVHQEERSGVAFAIQAEEGHCPFLDEEKLCRVHDVKPSQCRLGPFGILWPQGVDKDYDCLEGLAIPDTWSTKRVDDDFLNEVFFKSEQEAVQRLIEEVQGVLDPSEPQILAELGPSPGSIIRSFQLRSD